MRKTKLFALLAVVFAGSALVSCGNDTKQLNAVTENKQSVEEKKETPTEEKKETPVEEKKEEGKKESVDDGSKKQEVSDTITTTITYDSLKLEKATSYIDWTFENEGITYKGRSVPNGKTLQFNTKENNGKLTYAGLTNETAFGSIKSIKIVFNNNGKGKSKYVNKFNVFAGAEPIGSLEEICSTKKESHVTQFEFDNTQFEYTYEFTEGMKYFAIASDGYAFYLDSIEIVWTK